MDNETYNGWANYETWAVNLWNGNDETTYRALAGVMEQCVGDIERANALEQFTRLAWYGRYVTTGLSADVPMHDLERVNWLEIASHWRPDDEEGEPAISEWVLNLKSAVDAGYYKAI